MRTNKSLFTTVWALAFLFAVGVQSLAAATISLSLTRLDNRQARLYGPGSVDTTFSTKNVLTMNLSTSSTYTLEINPSEQVATVEFDLGEEGVITAIRWQDADESQTGGGFSTLSSSHYSLTEGTALELLPVALSVKYSSTDLAGLHIPALWLSSLTGGSNGLDLFPGDYEIETGLNAIEGQGSARLAVEVLESSSIWADTVDWQLFHTHGGISPTWDTLAGDWWTRTQSNTELELIGHSLAMDQLLSNHSVVVRASGKELVGATSWLSFPGNLDIGIGQGEGHAAEVQALISATPGALSDTVRWQDSDSSMAANLQVLSSEWLWVSGDSLHLRGAEVPLNLLANDNQIHFANVDQDSVQAGMVTYRLFPGDYLVKVSLTSTALGFEVEPNGNRGFIEYWDQYDSSIPRERLSPRFYSKDSTGTTLSGRTTQIDVRSLPDEIFQFVQLESAAATIPKGDSVALDLLPAGYMVDLYENGAEEAHWRCFFRYWNARAGIAAPVVYSDLFNGGNPYLPDSEYPMEEVWARAGGVTWYGLPNASSTPYEAVYPELGRNVDGAWVKLDSRELRFQYTDEYESSDPLSFKLMNWERQDVNQSLSLGLSLTKGYGDNRYALTLPGTVPAGHYVLEVTNEKDETFYLRFEVE